MKTPRFGKGGSVRASSVEVVLGKRTIYILQPKAAALPRVMRTEDTPRAGNGLSLSAPWAPMQIQEEHSPVRSCLKSFLELQRNEKDADQKVMNSRCRR